MRVRTARPRLVKLVPVALLALAAGLCLTTDALRAPVPRAVATSAPTPSPVPAQVLSPAQATASATPDASDAFADSVVFIDSTRPADTPVSTPPAPSASLATAPTGAAAPNETSAAPWSYATQDIRVEIRRHEERNLVYFTAELWLTDAKQWLSAFSGDRFDATHERVADIAERNGAVLAINGDFATFNNGGIILRNGELFRENRSTRQLLLIDAEGDFIPIVDPPEASEEAAQTYLAQGIWQSFVFGPVLVENGSPTPLPESFFINTGALEPRTAIAQLGPLHYLWLVVDGRQEGYSQGVSLARLQEILLGYGALAAFNLDGGGSSTLYFDGQVLNRPANGSARRVSDILYVGY